MHCWLGSWVAPTLSTTTRAVGSANRANLRRTGADREGLTAEEQVCVEWREQVCKQGPGSIWGADVQQLVCGEELRGELMGGQAEEHVRVICSGVGVVAHTFTNLRVCRAALPGQHL